MKDKNVCKYIVLLKLVDKVRLSQDMLKLISMVHRKNIALNNQEDLLMLRLNDTGISAEQLKDLEGPENANEKL